MVRNFLALASDRSREPCISQGASVLCSGAVCRTRLIWRRPTKTQRIRDPIYDEIVFDETEPLDISVWPLVDLRELQRLRRIKQLGLSEFVFPSATHTRFAHSLGVFHNARRLISLIKREFALGRVPGEFDEGRAKVAALAALLHDVGHGPFSHSFEEARRAIAGGEKIRKHEFYSGEMIRSGASGIGSVLADAGVDPEDVSKLIEFETPKDMYHAIVSSSFDADRLDYLSVPKTAPGHECPTAVLKRIPNTVAGSN